MALRTREFLAMVPRRLTKAELDLLRDIVRRRRPELLPLLDTLGVVPLSQEQREELRGAIADDFSRDFPAGDPDSHARDLLLEDLIDKLGHL